MAETFWLSFELKSDATYSDRYGTLIEALKKHVSGKWWFETTSFYVFSSGSSADTIAAAIKSAIEPKTDRVILGMTDFKTARAIGLFNKFDDLQSLIPFIKKA